MHQISIDLWKSFKEHFSQLCYYNHEVALKRAWQSCGNRTDFYMNTILPEIAQRLVLEYQCELFKVDAVLYKVSSSGERVPIIFIESENDAATATHEIRKLASLNAPCKILIVCCEWSTDLWKHSGRQNTLIAQWSKILKAMNEVWKLIEITGVIIAESGNVFRLTSFAWNENAELFEEPTQILQVSNNN